VDPIQNKKVFEAVDDELARRLSFNSINSADFAKAMGILAEHNQLCPSGYEINLELTVSESLPFLKQNLASFTKEEFIKTICGIAVSN
jgi:hypothetical protein